MKKSFYYRVSNVDTGQGLWYNTLGQFTGLIHKDFSFCKHNNLAMDYDPKIKGYLSVAESLEGLYEWFPEDDIRKLQIHGYYIHEYEATKVMTYSKFDHLAICEKTSILTKRIILL